MMAADDKAQEEYDKRFSERVMSELSNLGISPSEANAYDKKFCGDSVVDIVCFKVPAKRANLYGARFTGADMGTLEEMVRNSYKFTLYDGKEETKRRISIKLLREYDSRFSGCEIVALVRDIVPPSIANRYDARFKGWEVGNLYSANVSPELASMYDSSFSGKDIAVFHSMQMSPGDIERNADVKEEIKKTVRIILQMSRTYYFSAAPYKFTFINTGKQGVIVRLSNQAFKICKNPEKEYCLLKRVEEACPHQSNVIRVGFHDTFAGFRVDSYLPLEYIDGDTIATLLEKKRRFSLEDVLKYGRGILNGISELRQAGIYHRDIHERNILVDNTKDRAVIIDLGAATDDPTSVHPLNRAYGGNNDLISLGQLMHKMATGNNLFNEGDGFSCYSEVKEGIKTAREDAYDRPELKAKVLDKVRSEIPHKFLSEIMTRLINDGLWTQPPLEKVLEAEKMFEEIYRKKEGGADE